MHIILYMLLLEFNQNIDDDDENKILVRYRAVNSKTWDFMTIDFPTLNVLLNNFGSVSLKRYPPLFHLNSEYYSVSEKNMKLNYHGAEITVATSHDANASVFTLLQKPLLSLSKKHFKRTIPTTDLHTPK